MKNIIFFSFMMISLLNVSSQNLYELDLEKSIEIAKKQSFRMLILNKRLEQSEYQLQAAKRNFRTKVNFDLTGPRYTKTIRRWENNTVNYDTTSKFEYRGYLTINQPLPTDGNIFISSEVYNNDDFTDEARSLDMGTRINFNQPIEALYAYNRIKSELKRAELNYESTLKNLKRTELDIIYETSRAFYNLLSTKQRMEIASQILNRQKEAYEIAQNKYSAGLIREVEALQIEVDLGQAQNDYDLAISNFESQSNLFKQNLGLSLNDSVAIQSEMVFNVIQVDVNKAIQHGLDNRLEIREREIDIEITKLELRRQKSEGLIKGDITAYYGFKGARTVPIDYYQVYSDTYQDMLNSPDDYSIGINIQIPLIDWGENKSRVKSIMANLEMNQYQLDEEKLTIEREIRNTINELESSLRRLQLNEKTVKLAEKSFEISEYRFKNGDIDSEALALDRQRINNARLSHLESYITYKLLIADLMRRTFYDFEKDMPVM